MTPTPTPISRAMTRAAGARKKVPLARECAVSAATLYKWLNGQSIPNPDDLRRFCEVTGADFARLDALADATVAEREIARRHGR